MGDGERRWLETSPASVLASVVLLFCSVYSMHVTSVNKNMVRLLIQSFSLVGLALLSSCGLLSRSKGPPWDEIAYCYGTSVFIYDLRTGTHQKIIESGVRPIRWAPDGRSIAFLRRDPPEYPEFQIYIADHNGDNMRIITLMEYQGRIEPHPDGGSDPVWSPDGLRIAYSRCVNCEVGGLNTEIFIADIDTSAGFIEYRLTNNPYYDAPLDWIDKHILIRSELHDDGSYDEYADCYSFDIYTNSRERIIECDSIFCAMSLRYSPEGNRIAFIGKTDTYEIYLMNSDGSDVTRITNNELDERHLSWSPDGERLVFMAGSQFTGGYLYVINQDGSGLHKIASGPGNFFHPEWRPY